MSDDLDDIEEPEDLDEEILRSEFGDVIDDDIDIDDLDNALGDDIPDGDLDGEDDLALSDGVDGLSDVPQIVIETSGIVPLDGTHTEEEDEEESATEDVEEALDMILRNRVVSEEDEDEIVDHDEDADDTFAQVIPRQPDEFVCQSCFLLKNASQLADAEHGLCKDCV